MALYSVLSQVSVIAKNIRNRRDHKGLMFKCHLWFHWNFEWKQVSPSALSELFEKVDVSGDGTISIEEYVSMCETYGIKVTRSLHLPLLLPPSDLGISLVYDELSHFHRCSHDVLRCSINVLSCSKDVLGWSQDVRPLTLFTCLPCVRWFYDDFQKLQWFAMILPPDREKEITNLTSWGLKIVATINFVRLGKTIEFDGFPMFFGSVTYHRSSLLLKVSPQNWHLQVQRRGQRESSWDCWCPRRGCRNLDFHFKPISLRFARVTSSGTSKIKNCSSNSGTQLYWDFASENVWYPNSQKGCVSNKLVETGKNVVPQRFPNKKTSLYRFLWNWSWMAKLLKKKESIEKVSIAMVYHNFMKKYFWWFLLFLNQANKSW